MNEVRESWATGLITAVLLPSVCQWLELRHSSILILQLDFIGKLGLQDGIKPSRVFSKWVYQVVKIGMALCLHSGSENIFTT